MYACAYVYMYTRLHDQRPLNNFVMLLYKVRYLCTISALQFVPINTFVLPHTHTHSLFLSLILCLFLIAYLNVD